MRCDWIRWAENRSLATVRPYDGISTRVLAWRWPCAGCTVTLTSCPRSFRQRNNRSSEKPDSFPRKQRGNFGLIQSHSFGGFDLSQFQVGNDVADEAGQLSLGEPLAWLTKAQVVEHIAATQFCFGDFSWLFAAWHVHSPRDHCL